MLWFFRIVLDRLERGRETAQGSAEQQPDGLRIKDLRRANAALQAQLAYLEGRWP